MVMVCQWCELGEIHPVILYYSSSGRTNVQAWCTITTGTVNSTSSTPVEDAYTAYLYLGYAPVQLSNTWGWIPDVYSAGRGVAPCSRHEHGLVYCL